MTLSIFDTSQINLNAYSPPSSSPSLSTIAKLLLGAQWLLGAELSAATSLSSALLTTFENHLLARLRAWLI